jgi:hypothetical protein
VINHVTDDGRNSVEHIHCFAHIINLTVCDAIEGLCGLSSIIEDEDFDDTVDNVENDPSYVEPVDLDEEDDQTDEVFLVSLVLPALVLIYCQIF